MRAEGEALVRTRFLVSFLARLSFELRSNSITRRSYGANPTTSRTIERTNLVRVDWTPFLCEGFTTLGMAVVGWPLFRPRLVSAKAKSHQNVL